MKALRVFKVALTPFNLDNILNISKGQPTHITIDNSDERQQTLTGLDTTHHTNATVYNPKNEETSTKTQEIMMMTRNRAALQQEEA